MCFVEDKNNQGLAAEHSWELKDSLTQEAGQMLDLGRRVGFWQVQPATDGGSKGQGGCWVCLRVSQR